MSSQTLSKGGEGPARRPDHFFGHFSIRDVVLGKGGFGTVVLGRHRHSNTPIAIKAFDPQKGSNPIQRCRNFAREVQMHRMASGVGGTINSILGPCDLPTEVLQIIDACPRSERDLNRIDRLFGASYPSPKERCYLAMELANMGTLHLYLYRHEMLPEEQVRNFMFQLVRVVAGLHRIKMVHRDVKPSNILLQRRTEDAFAYSGGIVIKLADFGHAKVIPAGNELLRPGTGGTDGYIAPEFHIGSKCGHGLKVDIWSAGAVMKDMFDFRPRRPPILDWRVWRKEVWETVSLEAKDLFARCLDTNASNRMSAEQALQHPWFGGTSTAVVCWTTKYGNVPQRHIDEGLSHFAVPCFHSASQACSSPGTPSRCDESITSQGNHTAKANMATERFLCSRIGSDQRGRQLDRTDGKGTRETLQKVHEPTKNACRSSLDVQDGRYFSPLASVRENACRLEAHRASNVPCLERALLPHSATPAPPKPKRKRTIDKMETDDGCPADSESGGYHNSQYRITKRINAIDDDALASVDGPWPKVNIEQSQATLDPK